MIVRLAALILLSYGTSAFAECPAPDRQAVTDAVQAMFDAAAADDAGKLGLILAADFYAFDVGKRYDAVSLQDAIRKLHQSGKRIAWRVTSPDVHINCGTAWIAYINQGVLTESGKETPLVWLESANLVYVNNSWRIAFLESARATDPDLADKSKVSTTTESTEQEIIRLEKEFYAAVAAKDYDKIRLLIADDYVRQEQEAEKITREKIINRLKSGRFNYQSLLRERKDAACLASSGTDS